MAGVRRHSNFLVTDANIESPALVILLTISGLKLWVLVLCRFDPVRDWQTDLRCRGHTAWVLLLSPLLMIGRTTLVGLNQPLRQHLTSIQTLWAFISWIWRRTTSLRKTSPNSLQMDLHLCTLGKNIVATLIYRRLKILPLDLAQ